MPSHSSIFSFKRANPLAAVVIFVAAVVLVETGLTLLPDDSLVQTFEAELLPTHAPDWQIMGDSVAQGGISATQLTSFLPAGQFVYNLATPGTGPEFPYFQLKREIAAGVAPKAIIYAPAPHTFASLRVPLLIGAFCDWSEILEVSQSRIEPLDVLYGIMCKMSYTLRNREQIRAMIKGSYLIKPKDSTATNLFTATPYPRWLPKTIDVRYRQPFLVRSFNRHFFQEFLHLAEAHHVPVYWASIPVMPAVNESRQRFGFEPGYYKFLDEYQSRNQLRMLQREFPVWSEDHFKDQTHLTPTAAQQFTALIGEKLKSLKPEVSPVIQSPR